MNEQKIKVALMTFHNTYNYGAAMQAYALQETLGEMGVEAEYIDYINSHRRYTYDTQYQIKNAFKSKKYVRAVKLALGAGIIRKRGKKFNSFYKEYLHLTDKIYHSSDEAAALNDAYDKFIVGSDQVWNTHNNGGDTAYILDFVENSDKKLSYSSSFGMDDIPEEFVSSYTSAMVALGRIAVREVAGAGIVEKYTGRKPHVVLDPVFLPDLSTWEKLKNTGNVKKEEYIFFYTNRDSQIRDFWNIGYPSENLKSHILSSHVGIKDFLDKDVSVCVDMAPADFLNEIASAKLVVTASFHCVAFSILFHKQFSVFLTGNRGKDERILNLLHICGLESRIINASTTVEDINRVIDYDDVDRRLNPYRDYSKAYLKNAVFSSEDVPMLEFPNGESKYYCDDERCTGCMACASVCPVNAIEKRTDSEGFFIPERNIAKCIDCGKCNSVCQVYHPITEFSENQSYYAAKNMDSVRKNSSSGGVFTAVSDEILSRDGVICAAYMAEDFKVNHGFATSPSERDAMRGTYYVQSDISETYERIKSYLKEKKEVLFVGTPCQVAGIYKALDNVDTSLLYTCDLVCHGVPSPGVYESFIKFISEKGSLDAFRFRDKELGWIHSYSVSVTSNGKKHFNELMHQSYVKMFSRNMINRLSCANCMYTNYNRVGDITIGDFWGIEKTHKEFKDSLGVSLLMVNTSKGEELISKCSSLEKISVKREETKQNSLIKSSEPSGNRMDAFRIYSKEGYETLATRYGEYNCAGFIKNLIRKYARR